MNPAWSPIRIALPLWESGYLPMTASLPRWPTTSILYALSGTKTQRPLSAAAKANQLYA